MFPANGYPAVVSVQSRECGTALLARLPGSALLPERSVGAVIVAVVRCGGGALFFVTDPAVIDADEQVDYFLNLLPEEWEGQLRACRDRVVLGSLDDESARSLSAKLLDPDSAAAAALRGDIRAFVERERRAGARVWVSSFEPSGELERWAEALGLPGDQAQADLQLGTKATGRSLFHAAGIPVPDGTRECRTLEDLAGGIAGLVQRGKRRLVLKLCGTEFGAGMGNALLDLSEVRLDGQCGTATVLERLPGAERVDPTLSWAGFVEAIGRCGIVAEERLRVDGLCSPSFQGRVVPGGVVEMVSTHDQVLNDAGSFFVGSVFPAAEGYRAMVIDYGLRVGKCLIEQGVLVGDFGADFLAARVGQEWRLWGCEVNLRATGTKHGFTMMTSLLHALPGADGRLVLGDGSERVYQATDGIADARFVGMRPRQLIAAVRDSPLHYDHEQRTGVVLHMLSTLPAYGKFGAVCIGRTRQESARLMDQVRELAVQLAESAMVEQL
ncbi:MAG TPA: peptide ligase PGM1-related protein [Pseudonocardiaceae bacterium]|nr:peptide ligase PGM1-related protein [Pseudonocardiaceae bacterium]